MLLAKPEVTIRPVKRLLRDVSPITEVPGKSRRLLTCDPALIAGTPRAPTTGMTPDGLVFHPAHDAVAPGVAGSRKRGLEVHTPHRASTARAAKRRRFSSLMEQGDEITALPGRTRLEALIASRPTRLQYFTTVWLLACWAMGHSSKVMDGC